MDPPSNGNISEECLFLSIHKPSKAALNENGDNDNNHDNESKDCLPVMFGSTEAGSMMALDRSTTRDHYSTQKLELAHSHHYPILSSIYHYTNMG